MNITVVKRNGDREPLHIEKWQAQVAKVCKGIADVVTEDANDLLEYYVYVYYCEKSSQHGKAGSPYYVGIGKDYRAWTKGKGEVGKPTNKEYIVVEKTKISSVTAKKMEVALVAHFGRIDIGTGMLRNKTDGGDGVQMFGKKNPMFGKTGEKHHMFGKERPDMKGENNPMFGLKGEDHPAHGYKHTEEDLELIRKSKTGVKRVNFDQSGSKNPMYGKTGEDHPNYGMKYTKKQCPDCGVLASGGMFNRWHLNSKCQNKNKKGNA
jgi:hypothetical protein